MEFTRNPEHPTNCDCTWCEAKHEENTHTNRGNAIMSITTEMTLTHLQHFAPSKAFDDTPCLNCGGELDCGSDGGYSDLVIDGVTFSYWWADIRRCHACDMEFQLRRVSNTVETDTSVDGGPCGSFELPLPMAGQVVQVEIYPNASKPYAGSILQSIDLP